MNGEIFLAYVEQCSRRPLPLATSSSWTISAATRSRACAGRSRRAAGAWSTCRLTALISTRSSRPSPSSRRCSGKSLPAPSPLYGTLSATSLAASPPTNAPTISPTPDMFHSNGIRSSKDERIDEAIRVAVTSQSTRKRITSKLMNELATALILRAVAEDRGKVDQIRRYLRHAFSKSAHRDAWQATGRSTEQLVNHALAEVREAIGNGDTGEPGPASLELAIRASYPLVVSGRLNADRGSSGNEQPDRRTPGEVLDAMRRSVQGVHQLGQALRDFAENNRIRAVEENGGVKRLTDGSDDQTVNDIYLQRELPPPGKA